jgi:hypothetical protein
LTTAKSALGAPTYKDTVAQAVRRVVEETCKGSSAEALRDFALATEDLGDPEVMDAAWR